VASTPALLSELSTIVDSYLSEKDRKSGSIRAPPRLTAMTLPHRAGDHIAIGGYLP